MNPYPTAPGMQPSTSYGTHHLLSSSNPPSVHSSPQSFTQDLDPSSGYNGHPSHSQTYSMQDTGSWSNAIQQPQPQQHPSHHFASRQTRNSFSGSFFPNTPSLQVRTNTQGTEHDPNERTARPGNAYVHEQFHNALSLSLPPMPDSGNNLVTPTATTSSMSSMSSAGLSSSATLSSASSIASNFSAAQQRHLVATQEQKQPTFDDGSDYIAGAPGLSKGLGRPLTQIEKERLAYLDRLKYFLATAPSRWDSPEGEQSTSGTSGASSAFPSNVNVYPGMGLDGSFASHGNQNTPSHPQLNRFMLPSQEFVTCVLWNGLYHITGTDIVRALVFRFEAFGRPVRNMKKFEEGVFSDLRNLKPGVDACLEDPKSPFLDLLFKYQCIRTQKKQKVFYWFSVPHDRLFLDALDRDLKREKMSQDPTTIATGEPALSFTYDSKRPLYEQFSKMLGGVEGESEYDRNVRLAVKGSGRNSGNYTDGEDSGMDGNGTADESDHPTDNEDERRPRSSSGVDSIGNHIFGQIILVGSGSYKHRKRNAASTRRALRQGSEVPGDDARGRGNAPGSSGTRYGSTSVSRERRRSAISGPRYDSMMEEFGPGSADERQQNEPSLSAADYFVKQARGELTPADGNPRKPKVPHVIGEVGVYYSEGAPPPPSTSSTSSAGYSVHGTEGSAPLPRPGFQHFRNRSTDIQTTSSHPHRHSYHGSLTASFPDDLSYDPSGFTQASTSTAHVTNAPPSTGPQTLAKPPQPQHESSTAMYEQYGPDGKIKAFVCPLFSCGRLFKRMEHLKRHLRTHTLERPFACNKCNKKFSRSDNLNQHLRTHERTGPGVASAPDSDGDTPVSGQRRDDYMEDDSDNDGARSRPEGYHSGGESDEDSLLTRFGNAGLYGDSFGSGEIDLSNFAMPGTYSHEVQMKELDIRDVQEAQGDEEGLLVFSPGGLNNSYYQPPPNIFSGSNLGDQWSSGQASTPFGSFGGPPSTGPHARGNRNSMGSIPGTYIAPVHGHSATSSISSLHGEDLASSLSAPSHKAAFDHTAMYSGMMLDDTSSAGGPIRRHRSMTPSIARAGEPIRRPTTSGGEFSPAIPGSTPSSVGSNPSASSHRGYHPYGGYSSTSRGGSAHSSPAVHTIPLGTAGDYTQMRSRNSSFSGPQMQMMGTDVSMAPPEATFGEAMYRTDSPAFMAQSESPAPFTVDLPPQYGNQAYYASQQVHSATMPASYASQQQPGTFGEAFYPQHVSTL